MAKKYVSKVCTCGKTFLTKNDSTKCYECTLLEITQGNPPTTDDKIKAERLSGSGSSKGLQRLIKDLAAAERISNEIENNDYELEPTDDWGPEEE